MFKKELKKQMFTFNLNFYNYLIISSAALGFIGSYFLEMATDNLEQYISVSLVIIIDGIFGVIAGTKREGFKTYKALKIVKTFSFWIIILTAILSIEKGFEGTSWLRETIVTPFLIFEFMSILKNASMAGFISNDLLNFLLDKIDNHKGERTK